MLKVTRRPGETLVIGDNVRITVQKIGSASQIVLAIDAPREISIQRSEREERRKARHAAREEVAGCHSD